MKFEDERIINTTISLVRLALHEGEADEVGKPLRISAEDIPELFRYGQKQQITGLLSYGLERAEIIDANADETRNGMACNDVVKEFKKYRYHVAARVMRFNEERSAILRELEDCGIWYMPLKGIVMKDEYQELGMRDMVDNDILIDRERRDDVRDIFVERGYRYNKNQYGKDHDDAYYKDPIFNFEMHSFLGEDDFDMPALNDYYRNASHLMIKDEDNEYGYHMKPEDFIVYLIAHAFKHFNNAGVGIRSLIDVYVYLSNHADMDMYRVRNEMEIIGVRRFGDTMMELAREVFDGESKPGNFKLCEAEQRMFELMTNSGIHGTAELSKFMALKKIEQGKGALDEIDIHSNVGRAAKLKYIIRRIAPGKEALSQTYEFCVRHPHVYWLIHFRRVGTAIADNRDRIIGEIRILFRQ